MDQANQTQEGSGKSMLPNPHGHTNEHRGLAQAATARLKSVKSFAEEFKTFILRGNAVDLAIGVVIGAAFNEFVNSLVKDIILGTVATLAKQPDFSTMAYGAIKWGSFINSIINLIVVGFAVFVTIKVMNRLMHREVAHLSPEKK